MELSPSVPDLRIQPETAIFRYMSFDQFVFLVANKLLYLNAVSLWDDPFEVLQSQAIEEAYAKILSTDEYRNRIPPSDLPLYEWCLTYSRNCRDFCFGTSWSLSPDSDALWRIFCPNSRGVAIQTTVGRLDDVDQFILGFPRKRKRSQGKFDTFTGQVVYRDVFRPLIRGYFDLPGPEHFFQKRTAFSHEQEVRKIVVGHPVDWLEENVREEIRSLQGKCIHAEIEPACLVEKVVVHPLAPDWFIQTVRIYCERNGLGDKFCGRSRLYMGPGPPGPNSTHGSEDG